GGGHLRPAAAHSAGHSSDAAALEGRRAAMSDLDVPAAVPLRQRLSDAGAVLLGIVLLVWTLTPIYEMVLVAVQEKEDVFSTNIWPPHPTVASFIAVFQESYWYLEN